MTFINYLMIVVGAATVSYYLMKFFIYLDEPKHNNTKKNRRAA